MAKCEYVSPGGHCGKTVVPGHRFCEEHSAKAKRDLIGQYQFASKFLGDALARHSDHQNLKTLVGEIAVLKSIFEKRVNSISSAAEMEASAPHLQTLAEKIEKLVTAAHNLDVKLGRLLNKAALMKLAQEIIRIIEENLRPLESDLERVELDELIEKIGFQMVEAIALQENDKNG